MVALATSDGHARQVRAARLAVIAAAREVCDAWWGDIFELTDGACSEPIRELALALRRLDLLHEPGDEDLG